MHCASIITLIFLGVLHKQPGNEPLQYSVPPGVAPQRLHGPLIKPDSQAHIKSSKKFHGDAKVVRFAALNKVALHHEDRQPGNIPGIPLRIGINQSVPEGLISMQESSDKNQLADGTSVRVMKLEIPGAIGVRLNFRQLDLPENSHVIIADGDGYLLESLINKGPLGTGKYWSVPIKGEVLYIEYQGPADPDFDPAQRAFYYFRVIEIPTPRWTTYDAVRFRVDLPKNVPATVQDRAYTSPIWYTPKGS